MLPESFRTRPTVVATHRLPSRSWYVPSTGPSSRPSAGPTAPAVAAELKEALERGGPDRPAPILCERQHVTSGEPFGPAIHVKAPLRIRATEDGPLDADPDASVTGDQQGRRRARWQTAAGGSAPLVEPGAVEADQPGVSGQPQVAVAVLPDRADASGRRASRSPHVAIV